jgi:LPS export ABC transporter permease LptG
MGTLTRYILKEMIGPTFLGFLFYTSIVVMQQIFQLAGTIIKRSLSAEVFGQLLLYSLPNIIVLTVPMSLLFGILIAVGRLSSDSEIVAMRALGISTRTIYRPVFLFSLVMFLLNLYLMNTVLPRGNQVFASLRAEIMTSTVDKAIKPRVFFDQHDNVMIYVNDVDATTGQWKGVFVADSRGDESRDLSSPRQMSQVAQRDDDGESLGSLATDGSGQRIIVAETGNLSVIQPQKDIWMNLFGAETHVWDPRREDRYDRTRNQTQRVLLPSTEGSLDATSVSKSFRELNLRELIDQEQMLARGKSESDRADRNRARVEIHKKFAIPFACIAFGVIGLPLGITNRRGGKSSGFSLSIAIILLYYVMLNNGEDLAVNGTVAPWVGMWSANILLLGVGIYLLRRANRDSGARSDGGPFAKLGRIVAKLRTAKAADPRESVVVTDEPASALSRLDITFPNILDRYVLREFVKVLLLVLVSVVALFLIVDYTEIARDVRQNGVSASTLLTYYRFQIFTILNWTLPISVLVATLITFSMLAKNNEITAVKSNGVSLYRIGLPVVAIAVLISILSYFILDFVLPYANQRVYEMKRRIDGKPVVTAKSSQQKLWYLGKGRYLINFLAYDRSARALSQVQVFEFHATDFRLTRRVYARSAKWNGQAWAFEDGWMRSFTDDGNSTFTPITKPIALFYSETPEDFATEVKSPDQMTYSQLRRYIDIVSESGYAADELLVKLYSKTSWPALSTVMALIAMPFAFKIGKRGALYGVGIALALGIVYWMVFAIFTKFGEVGNLPPLLSAWAANILFALAAVYMFVHVET